MAAVDGAARGHVDFEFTVERDGNALVATPGEVVWDVSLDKAAEFAVRASKLLPLPNEYGPTPYHDARDLPLQRLPEIAAAASEAHADH